MSEDAKYVKEVGATLKKQQDLIKQAQARETDLQTKIASMQTEMQIYKDVISLVSQGVIDPSDAPEKLALFLEDPDQVEVLKQALALGLDRIPKVGSPVDEESMSSEDEDPITKVLREQEPHLRRI
jgi:hypothetical protein